MAVQETTPVRWILAPLAGAAAGTVVITIETLIETMLRAGSVMTHSYFWNGSLIILGITLVFFGGGMTMIGAPLWALAHARGRRGWHDAVLLGALGSFVVAVAMQLLPRWFLPFTLPPDWIHILEKATLTAIAGAAAGLALWRTAYR